MRIDTVGHERRALIDSLECGDLVRINGTLRIVRSANRRQPGGKVYTLTFAIRRCSWTHRPYTVMNRAMLYHADLEVIQRGYGAERGPLEIELQAEIADRNRRHMHCCDVIGVID